MFLNVLLISLVLLSFGVLGMMLNILVKKKGKFPEFRVGHNKDMAKKGVGCVKHEEIKCHKARLKAASKEANKEAKEEDGCVGCEQLI